MPKLALKIDCMNTDSSVRPGTMKLPKWTPFIVDMRLPMADAEDDEIERGGDHRRDQALPQGAAGPRHFEAVDRRDAMRRSSRRAPPVVDQLDENVLEARLVGRQVLVSRCRGRRARASARRCRCARHGGRTGSGARGRHRSSVRSHSASASGTASIGSASTTFERLLAHPRHQRLLLVDARSARPG